MLAWVSFFGAACLGIGGFFEGANLSLGSTRDLLLLAGLAFVVQLVGWLAIYFSLERLPASRSALIILLQPTFAMIWGQIFFGESLTMLQLGGAALTLAAIYIGAARDLGKGTPVVS